MDVFIAIVKQGITKTMHGSRGSAMIKDQKKYLLKDTLGTAENKGHHNLYGCFWHTNASGKEMLQRGHLSGFVRLFMHVKYASINGFEHPDTASI